MSLSLVVALLLLAVSSSATIVLRVASHPSTNGALVKPAVFAATDSNRTQDPDGDVIVYPDAVINAHVVKLQIGDSPQPASVLIDTGSPDTLVLVANADPYRWQGAPSPPRTFSDFLQYSGPILYDLRLSAKGKNFSCAEVAAPPISAQWCDNALLMDLECGSHACVVGETYGDGSVRLGAVERDVVDLGVKAELLFLRALRLGSGHLSAMTDNAIKGILGLSPSDEKGHLPSTLDQLKKAGAISHRVFALCLPDSSPFEEFDSADNGDLVIGAAHDDLSPQQLAANREFSTPLFTNITWYADNGTFVPRYLVQVSNVIIGSKTFPFSKHVLIDSGSVRTILPPEIYDLIADTYVALCSTWANRDALCSGRGVSRIRMLFGMPDHLGGGWVQNAFSGLTESDLSQFPPLEFDVGGGKVQIDWRHMFLRQDHNLLSLALWRGSDAMPMTVLGNNMMRAYRTVFDVDAQTITFATPNVCSKRLHRALPPWMVIAGAAVGGVVVILLCVVVVCLCRRRRRTRQESLLDAAARQVASDEPVAAVAEAPAASEEPAAFVRV
jgi:hypothetical protein